MKSGFGDLEAFVTVARAGGFREGAKIAGVSASGLSDAVKRLEERLGVRLLNRTTRSVTPTEAGRGLLERLEPVFGAMESALDVINGFRERPAGTLKLNVPISAARLVLPRILPGFLSAYPDISVEVTAEDRFVDVFAAGFDAGIRYEERLEQDMIAVPIGPRKQRFAAGAAPAYIERRGSPEHPMDLLDHACLSGRFSSGFRPDWEFSCGDEVLRVDPAGPLLVSMGTAVDLSIDVAIAGGGIVYLFEDWLRPYFERGELAPVLERWWPEFSGPFLYYPGRRYVPAPLRAFIAYIKAMSE